MAKEYVYVVTNNSNDVILTSLDKEKALDYAFEKKLIITAYKLV